ncbi:pseudouridine synthase [Antrihabitans sp. YC2-6]|uniref:pseudouridine synthase n=1 Tax=Antrihabitans sp. YC2-6 TaxID=2799498 RepID=UPI0018F460A5|nr:pseudouridine synthase [Antrihabitans sp. YC2-6]MBJ8348233.1 pseudouridine synthase [Antrihabitans sp. YC2-6]
MKQPARRDGTPDRSSKRTTAKPARSQGAPKAGKPQGSSSSNRSSTSKPYGAPKGASRSDRTEKPYGSGRSEGSGKSYGAPKSEGKSYGGSRSESAGKSYGSRSESAGKSHGAPRSESAPKSQGYPKSPSAQRPGGRPQPTAKPKSAKPERKPVVAGPKLSNAKPARHQSVESGPQKRLPWGEGVRLQKVLAQAGVASRRAAEEMIAAGRVEVDGRIVTEQGMRIDPNTAIVRVDGTRVVVQEELVHLALNKPRGWHSTMSDDLGRPCVGDIVAERIAAGQRLFHVGRLDADTEGLLLLTNDGDLAHRLMHPSYLVSKTYMATVQGMVTREVGRQLKEGVTLEDGPAKVDSFNVVDIGEGKSLVKIVLHEGRKHIVRRLLEAVEHPVVRLVRTDIGPVALGDQRPGTLRVLGRDEVGKLYEGVGL